MTNHLHDDQIAAALAGGELEPEVERHLNACVACRRSLAAFTEVVGARRDEMFGRAPDWDAQRAAVMERLPSAPAVSNHPWWTGRSRAFALAAAVACAVGLVALWPRDTAPPQPTGNELPVAQILEESDTLLEDGSIPGFEPIQWSTSELGLAATAPTPDTSS
jgi:anti-sigma factor RsiW